jgi:hypothetical protein
VVSANVTTGKLCTANEQSGRRVQRAPRLADVENGNIKWLTPFESPTAGVLVEETGM